MIAARRYWSCAFPIFFLLFSLPGALRFPGSLGVFAAFSITSGLLIALALPSPRLYSYSFFAAFLSLGFFLKLQAFLILEAGLIEPMGQFSGSPSEWNQVLKVCTAGIAGVVIARAAHLLWLRGRSRPAGGLGEPPPGWYIQWRRWIWSAALGITLAISVWNFKVSFYQVGVIPAMVLPMHLNVLAGWMLYIGLAMLFAVLLYWEIGFNPKNCHLVFLALICEAVVTSSSMLTRAGYLFHTVPCLVVMVSHFRETATILSKLKMAILLGAFIVGFLASLGTVSILRVFTYPMSPAERFPNGAIQSESLRQRIDSMTRQVCSLFVGRWIGLEGVGAVSSYKALGPSLLRDGLREDPGHGVSSIYQRISQSLYKPLNSFVFLTIPGIVAVLDYSGSLGVVFLGMVLATMLLLGTELVASRLICNPFFLSLVGISLANALCQMNFPYLAAVFFIEQWGAILVVGVVIRGWRASQFV